MTTKQSVIVAGAGPVGLLTALALAHQDVPVTVLESEPGLTYDLRAGTYHPPSLEIMAPYGITDEMHQTAIKVPRWQMRDRKLGLIVEWDLTEISDLTPYPYRLHFEQHKLTPLLLSRLIKFPHAKVIFSHAVNKVEQTAEKVMVTTTTPGGGDERFEADWLVGADGGRSVVRRCIDAELEGFTWPERFVVIGTSVDLAKHGYAYNAYVADPDEWCALFKMPGEGPPGFWRVLFPVPPEESDEMALSPEAVERRMQGFLKLDTPYPVISKIIYRVHQRVARRFRSGRVVLAGDAAHLNNPLGAFGLNGGIQDCANLTEKLGRICRGEGDASLLDQYERQRRTVNLEFVQEYSIRNFKRLAAKTPEERQANIDDLHRIGASSEARREFMLGSTMIASMRRANAIQ
jgi:3-(3-hydroxy-phenyl)propionate hydroxylase